MIRVSVEGSLDAKALAAQLRAERKRFRFNIAGRMKGALKDLRAEIDTSAREVLPKRGGYGATLGAAIRTTSAISVRWPPTVDVRIWAPGRLKTRDVASVDEGELRHMLFGNRKHWYPEAVPPGFATRPVEAKLDDLVDSISDGWDEMVSRIDTRS